MSKLKNTLRFLLVSSLMCSFVLGLAQTTIKGYIKDFKGHAAIPFCAVGLKQSGKGCLSNEQGFFQLLALSSDTLVLSCIGYKRKQIPLSKYMTGAEILLEPSETLLEEVVVYSNDDYLFNLLDASKKHLQDAELQKSKTYFLLETEIDKQPVELIECYYNSEFTANKINDLQFKNGRIGIAPYKDRFFVSLNSSKAFTFLNLLYTDAYMPNNPYQYNKKNNRKYFRLYLIKQYDSIQPVYQIGFKAQNRNGDFFDGELHILKDKQQLVKIVLSSAKANKQPFKPLFSNAHIKDVAMQITKTYDVHGNDFYLNHMDFNYQLNYLVNDSLKLVSSSGLMYFYDYNKLFQAPYFVYNHDIDDYKKITSLTYNDQFWQTNQAFSYSEKTKKGVAYYTQNGLLLNYKNEGNLKQGVLRNSFFEYNYLMWSSSKRLYLKTSGIKNDTMENFSSADQQIIANRYALKAQVFLDVNPIGDSLQHYSASIYDVVESYYNIREDKFTNCFLNIYFDLVEIERRKMEKEISKNKHSLKHLDVCYKHTQIAVENLGLKYFKEVERGKNKRKLEEWNEKVKRELGIDNIEIFNTFDK